jgi:hypothetical protein
VVDCLFLALFWHTTVPAPWSSSSSSSRTSIGLLSGTLVGGFVDCLTSLLFYPFVGKFPPQYTSYLLAGENLTGLLASLLATAQVLPWW